MHFFVGVGPGHIVLDGDPVTPFPKGAQQPPLFGTCLLCPNDRPSEMLLSSCLNADIEVFDTCVRRCSLLSYLLIVVQKVVVTWPGVR